MLQAHFLHSFEVCSFPHVVPKGLLLPLRPFQYRCAHIIGNFFENCGKTSKTYSSLADCCDPPTSRNRQFLGDPRSDQASLRSLFYHPLQLESQTPPQFSHLSGNNRKPPILMRVGGITTFNRLYQTHSTSLYLLAKLIMHLQRAKHIGRVRSKGHQGRFRLTDRSVGLIAIGICQDRRESVCCVYCSTGYPSVT